jgi:hypothetical protein
VPISGNIVFSAGKKKSHIIKMNPKNINAFYGQNVGVFNVNPHYNNTVIIGV